MKKLIAIVFAVSLIAPQSSYAHHIPGINDADIIQLSAAKSLLEKQGDKSSKLYKEITAQIKKIQSKQTSGKCYVNGYTRKDGTQVAGYYRKCRS